ncbi:RICIN domain-containing protein [Kineococcus sp. NPDC059986]|uniref:RICIN domain-containing protein n=1 Tax=Kineococcus sp. NPDC059986 TaxID=3155538 RepID=UPI00345092FE
MIKLVARALPSGRRNPSSDEGIAMLLVIMTILVTGALGLLLLGVVVSQVAPTQQLQKRTTTLAAAQAGMDSALSQLRSARYTAATGLVWGDKSKLPCTLTGSVDAGGGLSRGVRYEVTVTYYNTDPTGMSAAERRTREVPCPSTVPLATAVVPSNAIITSQGIAASAPGRSATSGNRTLQSIYTFQLNNGNIPGGLMSSYSGAYCLQAASATAGAGVRYVANANCPTSNRNPLQMWIYDKDYAIKLSTSITTDPTTSLCLTGNQASKGTPITLQQCVGSNTNQKWSYEGGAQFRGQNSANTNYGSYCFGSGLGSTSSLPNAPLKTWDCQGNSDLGGFNPEPAVGAGAARYETNQIVNYLQFGRCMDVTHGNVNEPQMITYTCKQDPSGGSLLNWNHKWYYTEEMSTPQTITVRPGATYCLQAPAATASPAFVTFASCTGAANQKFVRTYDDPDYAKSYTFKDTYGRCIGIGPNYMAGQGNEEPFTTIVMQTCNGGSSQKWNAPPEKRVAAVTGIRESTYDTTTP